MQIIEGAGVWTPPAGAANDWVEHMRVPDLSVGTYCIPAGGLDAARELLGDPKAPRRLPPQPHPPWVRALAFTLAFTALLAFAVSIAAPFFD